LEVQWQALPTDVTIALERATGSLKVDGVDQPLNGSSAFKTQWRNGSHSILWQASDADLVELQFEVSDAIALKNPLFRGSVFGIAAVLDKSTITYQSINLAGGITKTIDGQSESLPPSGTFPVPGNKLVGFKVKHGGYPLGDFQADPTGPPVAYVHLATLPRNTRGTKPKPIVEDPKDPPPIPKLGAETDPPKPTEEELRKERDEERRNYRDQVIKK
jgi:hypothetical protein